VEVEQEIHPQLLHQMEVMVVVQLVIVQAILHRLQTFKEQLTQEEAVEVHIFQALQRVPLVLEDQV